VTWYALGRRVLSFNDDLTPQPLQADEIDKGAREKFVSPPIPAKPSWWDDAIDGGAAAAPGAAAPAAARSHPKAKTGAASRLAMERLGAVGAVGTKPNSK